MTFIVVQQGVYMQGVWGPFPTVEAAEAKAVALAAEDVDDYHSYDVCPLDETDGVGPTVRSFAQAGRATYMHDDTTVRVTRSPTAPVRYGAPHYTHDGRPDA